MSAEQTLRRARNISTQPELAEGDAWGADGVVDSGCRLIYDRRTVTRHRRGKEVRERTGGFKHWKGDLRMAGRHVRDALLARPLVVPLRQETYGARVHRHLLMVWHYLFRANALDRPDGRVDGTTLYGVWVEEVWHASVWSPEVAVAVLDLLDTLDPEEPHAGRVLALLERQIDNLGRHDRA